MSATSEDIPSLTLRVLEKIQGELVSLNTKFDTLNDKVDTLNNRFDHFLTFSGRDVQDLKTRVSALEQRGKRRT
jgi:hypothetical protein